MAARAHPIHDYSLAGGGAAGRPRREARYRDDEAVVLPRGRGSQISGALVFSAVLATALVGGAAFAVYSVAPPPSARLAETPAVPLEKTYEPDPMFARANALNALREPQRSAPAITTPEALAQEPSGTPSQRGAFEPREVTSDDSAQGFQPSLPQPSESAVLPQVTQPVLPEPTSPDIQPQAPYPNPTTTPPEMVQPPSTDSEQPATGSEAENPYDLK